MANNTPELNGEVTRFLDTQNHPLRNEIDRLRACILSADPNLTENIKWNGPNYCLHHEDRITMKIHPPRSIQLIFHRGVKKQEQPSSKIIEDPSGLLVWKENNRAMATFKTISEIESRQSELTDIIQNWVRATT